MRHPDYPHIDFKPAIARFDWDQTYDVLEFVYLPQGFSQLMDLCGIPAFELMAIDRFTPYRYRWADQYSDVVYEFLKTFNFSPHNSINERLLRDESGEAILDENDNSITVPKFELSNTQVYDYAPILANFTEGKYQVTGLIYQGWQEGLTGSIPTINQVFVEFTLAESTEIDLNQILWNRWLKDDYFPNGNSNRFCSNSLVISKLSNGNWIDYTPSFTSKPTWLLYSDINTYFNNVKQQLIDYFQNIHETYFDIFFTLKLDRIVGNTYYLKRFLTTTSLCSPIQSTLNHIEFIKDSPNEYIYRFTDNSGNISQHVFDWIPSSPPTLSIDRYEFKKIDSFFTDLCCLHRANNNKWSMQTNYNNLGINKYDLYIFPPILRDYPDDIAFAQLGVTIGEKLENEIKSYILSGDFIDTNAWGVNRTLGSAVLLNNSTLAFYFDLPNLFLYTDIRYEIYVARIQRFTGTAYSGIKDPDLGGYSIYKSMTLALEYKIMLSINSKNEFIVREILQEIFTTLYKHSGISEVVEWGSFYNGYRTKVEFNAVDEEINNFTPNDNNYIHKFYFTFVTQQEWENNHQENAMTDQEYLDYLLQLKEQYEEDSKTW